MSDYFGLMTVENLASQTARKLRHSAKPNHGKPTQTLPEAAYETVDSALPLPQPGKPDKVPWAELAGRFGVPLDGTGELPIRVRVACVEGIVQLIEDSEMHQGTRKLLAKAAPQPGEPPLGVQLLIDYAREYFLADETLTFADAIDLALLQHVGFAWDPWAPDPRADMLDGLMLRTVYTEDLDIWFGQYAGLTPKFRVSAYRAFWLAVLACRIEVALDDELSEEIGRRAGDFDESRPVDLTPPPDGFI